MATALEVRRGDEAGLFFLSGEFDLECREAFESWVPAFSEAGGEVVFDLSGLEFMDSSGIHCLLRLAAERDVVIRTPSAAVRRVLQIAGLDRFPGIRFAG